MKIIVAGDFVPNLRVKADIEKESAICLNEFKNHLSPSDYAIVNLECPITLRSALPIDKTGPNLCCSEKALKYLAESGVKCVTLANNHFRDQGIVGIEDTIAACRKYSVDFVGGGLDLALAKEPLYIAGRDTSFCIINACEHEWSVATSKRGGSNPLNLIQQYHDIKLAKQKSDFVLVIIHGGTELYNLPSPRMKEAYRFFIEVGADAVVNHHQHCFSGYEIYKGKPIFYGIGNFCFDKCDPDNRLWNEGFFVEFNVSKTLTSFNLVPYEQCANNPLVHILDNPCDFNSKLLRLNEIIADENALQERFFDLAQRRGSTVNGILEPYQSRFMRALLNRNLVPSFANKQRLKQLLAHTQCESHRDLCLEYLETIVQ